MTHKPQAPYTLAVKTYGPAKAMYEAYPTLREAEKQATWHIDHVNRAQIVIADVTGTPVRIHNGNRLEKIESKHIPAEKMIEEAQTMTTAEQIQLTNEWETANTVQQIHKMKSYLEILQATTTAEDKEAAEVAIINYTKTLGTNGHTAYVWNQANK